MTKQGRLRGTRAYLAGAMDRVLDGGVGWRREVGHVLRKLGVVVLDPTNKPIDIGLENDDARAERRRLKANYDFKHTAEIMKTVRNVDLRMVDIADFLVVNIDMDVHLCGTYEEITTANRQKKPVIVHCEQGTQNLPDWLFAMLPYQMFFSTWTGVERYLNRVDDPERELETFNRWMLFDALYQT